MCGGIEYQNQKIDFSQPGTRLPARLRHGGVTWITWGKRKNEDSGKFPNMAIQGLLAERKGEQRIYVVTVNSSPEYHWIHDRWPRLVKFLV